MTVRIGIIGAGRRGHAHSRGLSAQPGVRVVGVADPCLDRARELAAAHDAATHADFRVLLDRDDLDAVVVASPMHAHVEHALAVAQRGVGLLLEKPVAPTLAQAREVAETVEQAGITAMVSYQWRNMPTVARLLSEIGDKPISLMRAHWYWTLPLTPAIRDKNAGGGQIVDQATHLIDLMRLVAGEVETVQAAYTLAARVGEFDNWDGYSVTLSFRRGAVGSVATTYALHPEVSESTVDIVSREMLARLTPAQLEIHTPDGVSTTENDRSRSTERLDALFVAALTGGLPAGTPSSTISTVRDAVDTLAVTLAANQAAETGRPVRMAEFLANGSTN